MTTPEFVLPNLFAGLRLLIEIQYLSGSEFKAKMSHIVSDLAGSIESSSSRWVPHTSVQKRNQIFPIVSTSLNGFTAFIEAGE